MMGPVVILGDLHAPFVDKAACSVAVQVIQSIGPRAVVLNGDMADNYALSRFDKDSDRITSLRADLDCLRGYLEMFRDEAPEADFYYTEGNHEVRLSKVKCKVPELAGLEALTMPNLLDFASLGIAWVPEREKLQFGDWLILHGNSCCSKGGATGQRMIDRYGCSGISNHVHRLAQVSRTVYGRQMTWIENGCLCDPAQMEYGDMFDWQHGFTVLHQDFPELVHIKNGKTRFRGEVYSAC